MIYKTLCEHIIQDGVRKNEMCGCYVYKDECIYCEKHESIYSTSDSCFENVIKYFRKYFRKIERNYYSSTDICKLV